MKIILLVEEHPLQALVRKSILEKRFTYVRRVSDAAEALCLIEQPGFADNLGLVITGPRVHGLTGPAFVAELRMRLPEIPVLVLGGAGESARDFAGDGVRFLARPAPTEQLLAAAGEMLLGDVRAAA